MGVTRSDNDLWEEVVNGSNNAFSLLFERYWSIIYKTVFSYTNDREQSEEITHDIFLNLWRGRHTLIIQSFPAYLRTAARYHVYRFMKNEKLSPIAYVDDWDLIAIPTVANAGEEKISATELEMDVDQVLVDLPTRCKEIFFLSRKENLSNHEIAVRLGISKRSVENQLTRALKHLRVQLKTTTLCIVLYILLSLCPVAANMVDRYAYSPATFCPHESALACRRHS